MPFLLKKERRIKRSGEYRRIYGQGEKRTGKYLVLFILPAAQEKGRVGITVSRKVGNACERNRAKRQIREALAREIECVGPLYDIVDDMVFVAKSRIKQALFMELRGDIRKLIGWQGGREGRQAAALEGRQMEQTRQAGGTGRQSGEHGR